MKILILCTSNSCRSQMAEAILKSFDPTLNVYSAGTFPTDAVHAKAVKVMKEAGINISGYKPKNADLFVNEEFDYLVTVCDAARESCPVFWGKVKSRLHIDFDDPAEAQGTEEEQLAVFRRVRDEIRHEFSRFYKYLIQK